MNEILPGLWVGDMSDANHVKGFEILSVMWDGEDGAPADAVNIPTTTWDEEDLTATTADCQKLNEAADWIAEKLTYPDPVLVCCSFGMQRSPLTIVWYLMRHKGYSVDEAYRLLKTKRGLTADRRQWLPENYQEMLHADRHVSQSVESR